MKKLKDLKEFNEKEMNDSRDQEATVFAFRLSLSLALQTVAINAFSLVFVIVQAFCLELHRISFLFNLPNANSLMNSVLFEYLPTLQGAAIIINSNVGLLIHCCFSPMYRKTAADIFCRVNSSQREDQPNQEIEMHERGSGN